MTKETSNFGFKKPDPNEFYDINIQNENWDKADKMITHGTEDLIEGESELPTGTLYFVHE